MIPHTLWKAILLLYYHHHILSIPLPLYNLDSIRCSDPSPCKYFIIRLSASTNLSGPLSIQNRLILLISAIFFFRRNLGFPYASIFNHSILLLYLKELASPLSGCPFVNFSKFTLKTADIQFPIISRELRKIYPQF